MKLDNLEEVLSIEVAEPPVEKTPTPVTSEVPCLHLWALQQLVQTELDRAMEGQDAESESGT